MPKRNAAWSTSDHMPLVRARNFAKNFHKIQVAHSRRGAVRGVVRGQFEEPASWERDFIRPHGAVGVVVPGVLSEFGNDPLSECDRVAPGGPRHPRNRVVSDTSH